MGKILFIFMMILNVCGTFENLYAATDDEMKEVGSEEDGGAAAAAATPEAPYGRLSSTTWESYAPDHSVKEVADGEFDYALPAVLKECARTDGHRIRTYYTAHLEGNHSPPRSTNFATVRVFYQTESGKKYHKEFPYAFLSGIEHEDLPLLPRIGPNLCLGNIYPTAEARDVWRAAPPSPMLEDFLLRGFTKKEVSEQKGRKFSHQHFAHSEQAFISYIMRNADAMVSDERIPTGIIIMMSSTRDTCRNCNQLIKNFLFETPGFKHAIIKRMFPRTPDHTVAGIPVTVIYVYHLKGPGYRYAAPGEDLLEGIDFRARVPYIKISGLR
jgi:hypothetical protein